MTSKTDVSSVAGGKWTTTQQTSHPNSDTPTDTAPMTDWKSLFCLLSKIVSIHYGADTVMYSLINHCHSYKGLSSIIDTEGKDRERQRRDRMLI